MNLVAFELGWGEFEIFTRFLAYELVEAGRGEFAWAWVLGMMYEVEIEIVQ